MDHSSSAAPRRDTLVPPAPSTHRPVVNDPQPARPSAPDLDFPTPPDLGVETPDLDVPAPDLDREAQRLPAAIVASYVAGESTLRIAARLRASASRVARIIRQAGVPIRSPSERMRTYACDHSYFDVIDTEAKAYWLGFLAADGYVSTRNELSVSLAAKDAGHLAKLRDALSSTHPLLDVTKRDGRHPQVRLVIQSAGLTEALASHGVTNRKSATMEPPVLGPDLMRHFWRGAFDGDGCVTSTGRGGVDARVSFCGSIAMVSGFARFIASTNRSNAKITHDGRKSASFYHFACSGNHGCAVALRSLYAGSTVYLDRKRERAQSIIAGDRGPKARACCACRLARERCTHGIAAILATPVPGEALPFDLAWTPAHALTANGVTP